MDEIELPVMITTYEAFCACMEQHVIAVYIYAEVFAEQAYKVYRSLEEHGYEIPGLPIGRGALFVRGIRFEQCVFSYPYNG